MEKSMHEMHVCMTDNKIKNNNQQAEEILILRNIFGNFCISEYEDKKKQPKNSMFFRCNEKVLESQCNVHKFYAI